MLYEVITPHQSGILGTDLRKRPGGSCGGGGGNQTEEKLQPGRSVITSYSIHYTKLYDAVGAILMSISTVVVALNAQLLKHALTR